MHPSPNKQSSDTLFPWSEHYGGAVLVLASIGDPTVIKQILEHLEQRAEPATSPYTIRPRATTRDLTGPEGTPGASFLTQAQEVPISQRFSRPLQSTALPPLQKVKD